MSLAIMHVISVPGHFCFGEIINFYVNACAYDM